ncbi:MAG: hypothetical protein NVS1B11_22140 [Terriglobales bacterium]
MAGLVSVLQPRHPYAAILRVRWQLLVNSLRHGRGRTELVSRILISLAFAGGSFGGALGLGSAAFYFVSQGKGARLSFLLWPVFFFWQLFPVMTSAFSQNFESSNLLRFPIAYRSYFFIRVLSGSLDAATATGSSWLLGIGAGISFANTRLLPPAAFTLFIFAAFNVLLARAVFAWLERWLAQRKTRELMAVLFFLGLLTFQLIGPLTNRYGQQAKPEATRLARMIMPVQRFLPPGLAANAIAEAARGNTPSSLKFLLFLAVYGAGAFWLLHLRLPAQYSGENLSEASAALPATRSATVRYKGWRIPRLPGTVTAVLEKEFHYLSRSGPMLLTFLTPVFMLLVFRSSGRGNFLSGHPEYAFPAGAAYSLLLLSNLIYNIFGADGAGMGRFFISPVSFRRIVAAKNLAHAALLGTEVTIVWLAVRLLFSTPPLWMTAATLAWILYALPVNFTVGNLLSIYSPKKLEWGTFGRQRPTQTTILVSFGIQIVTAGIGAFVSLFARRWGNMWFAALIFLVLAALSLAAYGFLLSRIDEIVLKRREDLIFELSSS